MEVTKLVKISVRCCVIFGLHYYNTDMTEAQGVLHGSLWLVLSTAL